MGARSGAGIVWVNPDRQEEAAILWLGAGAKLERARTLARYRTTSA